MKKKLYKSATDKKIFGVCGGIGEYFDIDSTWVRLIAAILILCYGSGLLVYIIAALVMPEASSRRKDVVDAEYTVKQEENNNE